MTWECLSHINDLIGREGLLRVGEGLLGEGETAAHAAYVDLVDAVVGEDEVHGTEAAVALDIYMEGRELLTLVFSREDDLVYGLAAHCLLGAIAGSEVVLIVLEHKVGVDALLILEGGIADVELGVVIGKLHGPLGGAIVPHLHLVGIEMVVVALHEELAANVEALFIDAEDNLYTFVLKLLDGLVEPYLGCTLGHGREGEAQEEKGEEYGLETSHYLLFIYNLTI